MAKCSISDCKEKAIGGFQELIPDGIAGDRSEVVPGSVTRWCRRHEDHLLEKVMGRQGAWLSARDLDCMG